MCRLHDAVTRIVPLSSSIFINRGVNPLMAFLSAKKKKKKRRKRGKKTASLNPQQTMRADTPTCLRRNAGQGGDLAPSICWLNRRPLTPGDPPLPQVGSTQLLCWTQIRPLTFALVAQEGLGGGGQVGRRWGANIWSSLGFPIHSPHAFSFTFHEGGSSLNKVPGPTGSASQGTCWKCKPRDHTPAPLNLKLQGRVQEPVF